MKMNIVVSDPDADYIERFRQKQEEIANDAATARTGFTERMAELVQLQQAEVLRLQKIIRDNTQVPLRYAETMAVASATAKDGFVKHTLVATANDKSVWLMENFSPNGRPDLFRWGRVPLLPQAADEADAK
jgi:hypothetical protein